MGLIKKPSDDDKLVVNGNGRPRFDWEDQETVVDRRKRLPNRLRRFLLSWTGLIFLCIVLTLVSVDVAAFVVSSVESGGQFLAENFAFSFTNLVPLLMRLVFGISIAVGQFALIFWFLGRARMYTIWPGTTTEGVGFKDYRGQPELLAQAKQVVTLLRGVRVFEESGGEPLNGLLLEGPPGTGKTWLAQAISTEAGVPFFYLDASSLQSMFFGIAPLKVMNLYRKARNAANDYGAAIIFIDEIDAVGSRAGVSTTNRDEADPFGSPLQRNRMPIFFGMGGQGILPTLLMEMSGFSQEHSAWARRRLWFYKNILRRTPPKRSKRLLTIGATNRIQALDPALLRPGRFDKKIRVDAPDMEGRRDIFGYYLSKMNHDESMDPLILAAETPFYTPADIKYVLNEALRYALFDGRDYVTYNDFRLAQPEHEMGLRQPIRDLTPEDKYRLAAHEAGHAIAIRLFMPQNRISRITIIRQGGAHGHVSHQPATESFDYLGTHELLMNRLRVSVGGRAGELEFVGDEAQSLGVGVGWGDASDFGQIRLVLAMMANAGMFGPLGADSQGPNYSPQMAEMLEDTFRMVLDEVRMAFRAHRAMGEALIQLLLEKDELLSRDVEAFFDQYGLYTPKIDLNPVPQKKAAAAAAGGR